jgi:hypothetical protein
MDLGVRQIRTAGKGSGSIELTLPSELRDLVGLPCRITLRDGTRPDLVLQPDLRAPHQAFATMWQKLLAALLPGTEDAPRFPVGAFEFGLQHREGRPDRPFLCWRDGLALAADPPHDPAVVARILAAQSRTLAEYLDIGAELAGGFGAACAYLAVGTVPEADDQEACDLTAASLPLSLRPDEASAAEACEAGAASPAVWHRATPLLAAAADLFAGWTNDPASYAALRAVWRRGRTIELNGDFAA